MGWTAESVLGLGKLSSPIMHNARIRIDYLAVCPRNPLLIFHYFNVIVL